MKIIGMVEQTLDRHGNLEQMKIYDFGNLSTPARTYTYLSGSNYTSRYIYNRLATATVTDGTNQATLVTNTYDPTALTDRSGLREHDTPNYGTGFPRSEPRTKIPRPRPPSSWTR